jgi:hypothetical protein
MDLGDMRERLIDQHRQLRAQIAELLSETARDAQHELDFRVALAELSDALARHNREEERLLAAVVPTLDAWGPVRKQLMDEHHASQHAAQLSALRSICECKPFTRGFDEAIDRAQRSLREILSHMDREERELIHPDVLRDDVYAVDIDAE